MCVIIYIPNYANISKEEVKKAWNTNPHGAGYSIQKNGKVYFKRGFMDLDNFWKEISPLIGVYNLLLHFRISTSKEVNRVQTHPYKKGNVTLTQGWTTRPVICMNGIISKQKEYDGCNDTMSFISDHQDAFANINQDILDIIEELTTAKWAVMKPNEVLLSSKFKEEDGRWYSNKNHLIRKTYYSYYGGTSRKKQEKTIENLIKDKKLIKSIKKDKELYEDLKDYVEGFCNGYMCRYCTKCLSGAKTLRDVKITLNENYYFTDDPYNYEDSVCSIDYDKYPMDTCLIDYDYPTEQTIYVDGKQMTEEEYFEYLDKFDLLY